MKTSTKRMGALVALLGVTASLTACGGGSANPSRCSCSG